MFIMIFPMSIENRFLMVFEEFIFFIYLVIIGVWRIWNFHTWLDPSYIHVQHISKGSSFIYNYIYMYLYIPKRNKIFILFFASVCFCLSSLGALQVYLYGAWQIQLRVASDFTEEELIPLSVRFIMCALQKLWI